MLLPQILSPIERSALTYYWNAQPPYQQVLGLRWSHSDFVAKQNILGWLQQYPDIARRPPMLVGSAKSLQQYIEREMVQYVAYLLERLLQAQFSQLFPDKRGRWDTLPSTSWYTLVSVVRFYQEQLKEADPTFSPPQPGDEEFFLLDYRILVSDGSSIQRWLCLTGRDLRLWREADKLPEVTDGQSLLHTLSPLYLAADQWLPDRFRQEPLIYQPVEPEDEAILTRMMTFLQTGPLPVAFPAREDEWEQEDYVACVSIHPLYGCCFAEEGSCEPLAQIEASRENLLEWGQQQEERMRHYQEKGCLDEWLKEQIVQQFANPLLQNHSHEFYFNYQAQVVLDEMIELLCSTFLSAPSA